MIRCWLSGTLITGRDAAHKRMTDLIKAGEPLPFEISGQVIYICRAHACPPGRPIGAAGPTTSYRMDAYAPLLMEHGLKGTDRQGPTIRRSEEGDDEIGGAVYFAGVWEALERSSRVASKRHRSSHGKSWDRRRSADWSWPTCHSSWPRMSRKRPIRDGQNEIQEVRAWAQTTKRCADVKQRLQVVVQP